MLEIVDKELDIADRLGQLMKEKNFTQSSLSRAADVPQPTINRILARVTREPRRESVVRLADCLGVSPEYLYESKTTDVLNTVNVETRKKSVELYGDKKSPYAVIESVESIYRKVAMLDLKQREKLVDNIIANLM